MNAAQHPEIDEHAMDKMREWLQGEHANCPSCPEVLMDSTDDQILEQLDSDYPGGVPRFLSDLETGDGELP